MKIIDTHAHIYAEEFDEDFDEMLQRAVDAGVERILLPNVDSTTVERMHNVAGAHKNLCFPMMGIHPTSVDANYKQQLEVFDQYINSNADYIAVGEIGLDLYWDKTYLAEQQTVFEYQVAAAIEKDLPISIHTRESFAPAVESLKKFDKNKLRGVFHCFTMAPENAKTIFSLGEFYLGIGGPSTYKNAKFTARLPEIPADRLLVETDCPYLPPVPYRGKRNEPSYTVFILNKLAEVYGLPVEEMADIICHNSLKLFFSKA